MKINKGTVFAIIGVVGTGATAILTARSVLKAECVLIEEHHANIYYDMPSRKRIAHDGQGNAISKVEEFKLTWKSYILPFTSFLITSAFILGSNISNRKKYAALLGSWVALNSFHHDYEEQVKEVYGEEAHQNIVNAIMIQRAEDIELYSYGLTTADTLAFDHEDEEEHIFYLPCSDAFFKSTFRKVLEAEYHLNRNYVLRGFTDLSEFHEFLGIDPPKPEHQRQYGWGCVELDGIYWIDFDNSTKATNLPLPTWIDPKQEVYLIQMDFGPDYYEQEY